MYLKIPLWLLSLIKCFCLSQTFLEHLLSSIMGKVYKGKAGLTVLGNKCILSYFITCI
jgi:hypothetical protein